jgi:PilZ domain
MSLDTVSTERRKNLRKRPPRLIYVELSAANGGMVRDISEDGFAVRAMMPMTSGEKTPFFFLLSESTRIEGEGEIVWVEDKGRVAGIRFTEISGEARKHIRNWLNDIADSPDSKEEEQTVAPKAKNFDQLREELHNAPARGRSPKPNKSMWPLQPPELVGGFQEPMEAEPADIGGDEREWRAPAEPIPFPETSSSTSAHEPANDKFGSNSGGRDSFENAFRSDPSGRRIPARNSPEQHAQPSLPDISKILMQPPKRAASQSHQAPVLEPLYSPHQGHEMFEPHRSGWFTPLRAITIMVLLAGAVAVYAYHQVVGESLVRLGQQISGTQTTQNPTPPPNEGASTGEARPPVLNPSSSAAVPSNATPPDSNQQDLASGNQTVPSTPPTPAPEVAPLSGPASPAASDTTQETGSMEYSKAQQLLRIGDTSEAVRLLWISVEKGNAGAELTLAELYWHGRGVARNCDQTRILLSAAARKGNTDAQRLLHLFEREGCE